MFRLRNRLEYLEAKGRALGQQEFTVLELRERLGRFRCVTRMEVDVALPAWAERVLRPRVGVVQHEVWYPAQTDGGLRYDILVELRGAPVAVHGQGTLTRVDWWSTRYDVQLEVTGTGRLFRERVERFVSDELHARLLGEREFLLRWLSTAPGAFAPA
jgi:Protein of unknown function (DUF2505)